MSTLIRISPYQTTTKIGHEFGTHRKIELARGVFNFDKRK
jgi:hypothetical protein